MKKLEVVVYDERGIELFRIVTPTSEKDLPRIFPASPMDAVNSKISGVFIGFKE